MPSATSTIGGPDRQVTVHSAHDGRLPPLGQYVGDVWERRRFVLHLARSNLKAAHADTVFGQLWQILNPLLLGCVYYLVVTVIRGRGDLNYFVHLIGALFLFYFVRNAMGTGATSVVNGGTLLLNSAFPRAILPLATTLAAIFNYLPTFLVYLGFHMLQGGEAGQLHATMLLLPFMWTVLAVFAFGMSMLAATVTVYFRDTTSFLPYLLRIWMYLSPVLLTYEQIVAGVSGVLTPGSGVEPAATTVTLAQRLIYLNPMMGFLRTWEALVNGLLPEAIAVWSATGWSLLALAVGGWFFLTHEREFAFRV